MCVCLRHVPGEWLLSLSSVCRHGWTHGSKNIDHQHADAKMVRPLNGPALDPTSTSSSTSTRMIGLNSHHQIKPNCSSLERKKHTRWAAPPLAIYSLHTRHTYTHTTKNMAHLSSCPLLSRGQRDRQNQK